MIRLREVENGDADKLFPFVYKTPVTDTLIWDGPDSLEAYRDGLALRQAQTQKGEAHFFTIVEETTHQPIGSASVHPEANKVRPEVGLWIGIPYQGKGYGSKVVIEMLKYGIEKLRLEKMEAPIFVGNQASRRIFDGKYHF
jgi:RimJ/RimL family protein N-acetyltransferase